MMADIGERPLPNCLCFTALKSGTFTLTIGSGVPTSSLAYVEYSTDEGNTWTKTDNVDSSKVTITTPTIESGNRVLWRGSGSRMSVNTSANNYSVFSSTCNHDIEGHICSLLYGNDERKYDSISSNYAFTCLFLSNTRLISSSGLVLPNNTTKYCYAQMFNGCSNHASTFKEIKAPTLYDQSMNRMFYGNSKLTKAPDILSTTASGNYVIQFGFYNCTKLEYIKCLLTSKSSTSITNWVYGVASSGIFVKNINAKWTDSGESGVPSGWTIIYYDPALDKYYLDQQRNEECDDHGNPI